MRNIASMIALSVLLALAMLVPNSAAYAQINVDNNMTQQSKDYSKQCTSFSKRASETFQTTGSQQGILSNIYDFLVKTVSTATEKLFGAFTKSTSYKSALYGALTLMIIFYGVAFTMGVVQPSFQQVLIRLFKMGVLLTLISPGGWSFFNKYVVGFFQGGTDELIKGVQQLGTGISAGPNSTPFYALDQLANFIIQPDTLIAIMGSVFAGGPFGLTIGALMIFAIYGFFMLVLRTLRSYAITYVARALVLGVAPIFFVFLLFDRTKAMFSAWLNVLINLALQPILLFTFLSFFMVLLDSSAKSMLGVELCWHEYKGIDGTPNKVSFWRFVDPATDTPNMGEMTWQGSFECLLTQGTNGGKKCDEFPINIVDLLTFLILVYLAMRFTEVVDRISAELSNAFVALDNQGRLDQMLDQQNRRSHDGMFASMNPSAAGVAPKQQSGGKRGK